MSEPLTPTTRPRPPLLRALGRSEPPEQVEVAGVVYRLMELFKHDSWAATALYAGPDGKVVCKFNRVQGVFGLPMSWLGRRLAAREAAALERLADVPGIARGCGPVRVTGLLQPHAVARRYIEGHPLRSDEQVGDAFFSRLAEALRQMHARGMAYVDLHKRENIIVDDRGEPYLIDFQICWMQPAGWRGRLCPMPTVLRWLQQSDLYHLHKHRLRLRPDQVPPDQRDLDRLRPWPIRLHRLLLGRPFRAVRRRVLVLLGVRSGRGMAQSETAPEDAVRREIGSSPSSPHSVTNLPHDQS